MNETQTDDPGASTDSPGASPDRVHGYILHAQQPQEFFFLPRVGSSDFDTNGALKALLAWGLGHIPGIGSGLSALVGLFWPNTAANVWDQIRDEVQRLIDESSLKTIDEILLGDIRQFQRRIDHVSQEIESDPAHAREHYINVAQDLIGFDLKFRQFRNDDINYHVLPLLSTTVLMQVTYWVMGIEQRGKILLSDTDVANLRSYISRVVDETNSYIVEMYDTRLENAYNTAPAAQMFDAMMAVRQDCRVHGFEYIQIWNAIRASENTKTRVYVDVISYSTLFGRQTRTILSEATALDEKMGQPLTPDLRGGRRNGIARLEGFVQRVFNAPRVGGIRITFADGASYDLGTRTGESFPIDLNGAVITKLEVWGNGAVDRATFHLSDGRQLAYGEPGTNAYRKFELEGHHIAAVFIASDEPSLGYQAANISVAYQLTEHAPG